MTAQKKMFDYVYKTIWSSATQWRKKMM